MDENKKEEFVMWFLDGGDKHLDSCELCSDNLVGVVTTILELFEEKELTVRQAQEVLKQCEKLLSHSHVNIKRFRLDDYN